MAAEIVARVGDRVRAWGGVRLVAATDLSRRAEYARVPPEQRWDRVRAEQASFVDSLAAASAGSVVAMRWSGNGRGEIEACLLGRVDATSEGEATTRLAQLTTRLTQVPDHCVTAEIPDAAALHQTLAPFPPDPRGIAVIQKCVLTAKPERPDAGVHTYVAIQPFARTPGRWEGMLETLRRHPHPLVLSVLLQPTTAPPALRRTLESESTRFGRLVETFQVPGDLGGQIRYPPDGAARTYEPIFLDALRRYAGTVFRFDVTLVSPAPFDDGLAEAVASALLPSDRDLRTAPSGFRIGRPTDHGRSAAAFAELQPIDTPDPVLLQALREDRQPDGVAGGRDGLVALRVLVDRTEAATLFQLPAAVEGALPGFRVVAPRDGVRRTDPVEGPSVLLGFQDERNAVRLAVRDLPRTASSLEFRALARQTRLCTCVRNSRSSGCPSR